MNARRKSSRPIICLGFVALVGVLVTAVFLVRARKPDLTKGQVTSITLDAPPGGGHTPIELPLAGVPLIQQVIDESDPSWGSKFQGLAVIHLSRADQGLLTIALGTNGDFSVGRRYFSATRERLVTLVQDLRRLNAAPSPFADVTSAVFNEDNTWAPSDLPLSALPLILQLMDQSTPCPGTKFQVVASVYFFDQGDRDLSVSFSPYGEFRVAGRYYCTTRERVAAVVDELRRRCGPASPR